MSSWDCLSMPVSCGEHNLSILMPLPVFIWSSPSLCYLHVVILNEAGGLGQSKNSLYHQYGSRALKRQVYRAFVWLLHSLWKAYFPVQHFLANIKACSAFQV